MGPMMGGGAWNAGMVGWPALVLLVLVMVVLAMAALSTAGKGAGISRRPRSPEQTLRERYARGEITAGQYREALVDVLKDRYVRGEIDLDEFEARFDRLLWEPVAREQGPGQAISANGEPRFHAAKGRSGHGA